MSVKVSESISHYMKDKSELPKSQVFNGKKYKLIWRKPKVKGKRRGQGQCAPPDYSDRLRTMYINPDADAEEVCDTIIHEGLHAEMWELDEKTVERIANNLSTLLAEAGLLVKQD